VGDILLEERATAGERVERRARARHVPVAAEPIGAQRIDKLSVAVVSGRFPQLVE